MVERVDDVAGELVVGRRYLVRAIYIDRLADNRWLWWPVIGPRHEDAEDFNFPHQHYHADLRFLNRKHLAYEYGSAAERLAVVLARPLSEWGKLVLPDPQWKEMRCNRKQIDYPYGNRPAVLKLNEKYAGQQAVRGKSGWVCPHRKALINALPVTDGVLVCPLHGLRIDVETGRCLGPILGAADA